MPGRLVHRPVGWMLAILLLAPLATSQILGQSPDCEVLAQLWRQSNKTIPFSGLRCCGHRTASTNVACVGGRVTAANLTGVGFSGAMPEALATLTELTSLSLDRDSGQDLGMTGPLANLTSVKLLRQLSVSGNSFSGNVDGLLPESIRNCSLSDRGNRDLYSCVGSVPPACMLSLLISSVYASTSGLCAMPQIASADIGDVTSTPSIETVASDPPSPASFTDQGDLSTHSSTSGNMQSTTTHGGSQIPVLVIAATTGGVVTLGLASALFLAVRYRGRKGLAGQAKALVERTTTNGTARTVSWTPNSSSRLDTSLGKAKVVNAPIQHHAEASEATPSEAPLLIPDTAFVQTLARVSSNKEETGPAPPTWELSESGGNSTLYQSGSLRSIIASQVSHGGTHGMDDADAPPHWFYHLLTSDTDVRQRRRSVVFPGKRPFSVVTAYEPESKDEVAVSVGDEVLLRTVYVDGWGFAFNLSTNEMGFIPLDFLRLSNHSNSPTIASDGQEPRPSPRSAFISPSHTFDPTFSPAYSLVRTPSSYRARMEAETAAQLVLPSPERPGSIGATSVLEKLGEEGGVSEERPQGLDVDEGAVEEESLRRRVVRAIDDVGGSVDII